MSVLLEALKKAAEDKKKSLEKAIDTPQDKVSSDVVDTQSENTDVLDLDQEKQSILNESKEKEASALDFKFSLEPRDESSSLPSNGSKDHASSQGVSDEKPPSLSLKLALDIPQTNKEPEKKEEELPLEHESDATLSTGQSQLKLVEESIEPTTKPTTLEASDLSLQLSDTLEQQPESVASLTSHSNNETLHNFESKVTNDPEKEEGNENVLGTNEQSPSFLNTQKSELIQSSDLERELHEGPVARKEGITSSMSEHETVLNVVEEDNIEEHLEVRHRAVEKDQYRVPSDSAVKKQHEEEDSYRWSLDALPGYLNFGKKNRKTESTGKKALNPILVSGALSVKQSKKRSLRVLLGLLLLLFVIGILFYGIFYYQAQYGVLEKQMKQYNLVKTPLPVATYDKETVTVPPSSKKSEDALEKAQEVSGNDIQNELVIEEKILEADDQEAQTASLNTVINSHSNHKSEGTALSKALVSGTSYTGHSTTTQSTEPPDAKRYQKENVSKSVGQDGATHKTFEQNSASKHMHSNEPRSSRADNRAVVVVHSEEALLSEAYLLYEQARLEEAKVAFESVLAMNANNEFALIGLGNIFAGQGLYQEALAYYQQVLAVQPTHLHAFESIANIAVYVELDAAWKDVLSEMAQDYPDSSILQYAQGNLYAQKGDWLAAQAAYFRAVSIEPDNADYLVNLAVSLDQLGHYPSAARYYTEALAFADVQPINFSAEQVKNRLITIRQFLAEKSL